MADFGIPRDMSGDADQHRVQRVVEGTYAAVGAVGAAGLKGRVWVMIQNIGAATATWGFTPAAPATLAVGEVRSFLAAETVQVYKGAASTLYVAEGLRG